MKKWRLAKQIRIEKMQRKNNMYGQTFSTLEENQRRNFPWLGGAWFGKGMEKKREDFIKKYQKETERLLKENPDLEIIN